MFSIVKQSALDLQRVAHQLGLGPDVIDYCLEAELVQEAFTDDDLAELRRLRRLQQHLEVNLAGAEIILRMRRRMLAMQAQLEALAAEMAATQARFERELRERDRRLARDWE